MHAAKFNLREFGLVLSINNSEENIIPRTKRRKGGGKTTFHLVQSVNASTSITLILPGPAMAE